MIEHRRLKNVFIILATQRSLCLCFWKKRSHLWGVADDCRAPQTKPYVPDSPMLSFYSLDHWHPKQIDIGLLQGAWWVRSVTQTTAVVSTLTAKAVLEPLHSHGSFTFSLPASSAFPFILLQSVDHLIWMPAPCPWRCFLCLHFPSMICIQ